MVSSVKIIRFTAFISALLIVVTYIVSLNMSYECFEIRWLSNNFLLTIIGGAFASMLVVLICEIQRYLMIKRETENNLFRQFSTLYLQLISIKTSVEKQLDNANEPVSKTLLTYPMENIQNAINTIETIDYTTFSSKNIIFIKFQDFLKRTKIEINSFISVQYALPYAINNDQIDNLTMYQEERMITSASKNTNHALKVYLKKVIPLINSVDAVMKVVDDNCKNRYSWSVYKTATEYVYKYSPNTLDTFMKEEV